MSDRGGALVNITSVAADKGQMLVTVLRIKVAYQVRNASDNVVDQAILRLMGRAKWKAPLLGLAMGLSWLSMTVCLSPCCPRQPLIHRKRHIGYPCN